MVVVAILAILAAIALPAYGNYVLVGKTRTAQADLRALSAALENHRQRTLSYPTATPANVAAIKSAFPAWSPAAKAADFGFSVNSSGSGYTVTATGAGKLSGCTLTLKQDGATTNSGCLVGW
ncbi:MAG TPA: prepilin-type cleavage/methylation domain-containing protein [Stenotrophomonas sp.]|nr:prepilin-type cleavage/methylation domain-containing protein [Stenotrophomonas sp.]